MDNIITSTTYVPLQPPYQIIKYSGDIAMQIGTLIVTIQKEGNMNGMGYLMETHSHPVVVYEDKNNTPKDRQLSNRQFLEGVVWSYVQVKDVSTICLNNSVLPWQEFVDFLRADMNRRRGIPLPTVLAYEDIQRLGAEITPPECKEYKIQLKTERRNDGLLAVESHYSSILALHADASSDELMLEQLKKQIKEYMYMLHYKRFMEGFSVSYFTKEERYKNIVEKLNQDPDCTDKKGLWRYGSLEVKIHIESVTPPDHLPENV